MKDGATSPPNHPGRYYFGGLEDAHASLPTDPALLKSDLFLKYHPASVVDDHKTAITHDEGDRGRGPNDLTLTSTIPTTRCYHDTTIEDGKSIVGNGDAFE